MKTLTEILDAARQLPIQEQKELIIELHEGLAHGGSSVEEDDDDWLPENFSAELTQAFYEAKCRALGREIP